MRMQMATENILTVEEVAEILGVSIQRVSQFCQQGRLGSKFAGRWMIRESEVERFQSLPRKPGRPPRNSED